MISRRDFLKLSAVAGISVFLSTRARFLLEAQAAQNLSQIPHEPGTG
jgi:hypothetical protein